MEAALTMSITEETGGGTWETSKSEVKIRVTSLFVLALALAPFLLLMSGAIVHHMVMAGIERLVISTGDLALGLGWNIPFQAGMTWWTQNLLWLLAR
jgi:hypothetical protein